jgi:hypothetical protein
LELVCANIELQGQDHETGDYTLIRDQFFAHSVEGQTPNKWQPLAAHLHAVALLTSRRAEKFGAARLGAVVGLLHDLGKYAHEFQNYIAGLGESPDHATAGALEIQKIDANHHVFAGCAECRQTVTFTVPSRIH